LSAFCTEAATEETSFVNRLGPILIACPERQKVVRGQYPCDETGQYLLQADGSFRLSLLHCNQDLGRCTATLCALHRLNRKGPATWYPDRIMAPGNAAGAASTRPRGKARRLSGLY
jgi:hypothetical protein